MEKIFRGILAASLFLAVLFAGCMGQAPTPPEPTTIPPTKVPTLPPTQAPSTVPPTEAPTTPPPTQAPPQEPFTIVKATSGEPISVDPAFDYEVDGWEIIQNVYETLFWYEGSEITEIIPWLAESYTVSPDGMTYTIVLRKGIRFHDGTDFNADAVVYSIQRVIKMGLDPAWILSDYVDYDGVKKIDDYTASITTKFPYAGFLQILACPVSAIVSPKAVKGHGGVIKGQRNEWMDRNAVGTGPFVLESWEAQQQITLAKNTNYWGGPKGTGLAKPEKVIIRFMSREEERIAALKGGEVDLISVSPQHIPDVKGNPHIEVEEAGISPSIVNIAFNWRKDKYPMFQDKNVRAAIAYAIDYDTILTNILKGWAVRSRSVIPPSFFGYDPTIALYEYNMEKAREALKKSSYSQGFKVEIAYYRGNETRRQIALHLKGQLAKLNIEVEILEVEKMGRVLNKLREGKAGVAIMGWVPDYGDPDNNVYNFLHSQGIVAENVGYASIVMDSLVEAGERELNPLKRKEVYYSIQKKSKDEYLYVWLYLPKKYAVHRNNIQGIFFNGMVNGFWYYPMTKIGTTSTFSAI